MFQIQETLFKLALVFLALLFQNLNDFQELLVFVFQSHSILDVCVIHDTLNHSCVFVFSVMIHVFAFQYSPVPPCVTFPTQSILIVYFLYMLCGLVVYFVSLEPLPQIFS